MPTQEGERASEKPFTKARPGPKSSAMETTNFILANDSKYKNWTMCSVVKCQKESPICYGMTRKFFEFLTEQSITTTSLKNAGKSSSMLRYGR